MCNGYFYLQNILIGGSKGLGSKGVVFKFFFQKSFVNLKKNFTRRLKNRRESIAKIFDRTGNWYQMNPLAILLEVEKGLWKEDCDILKLVYSLSIRICNSLLRLDWLGLGETYSLKFSQIGFRHVWHFNQSNNVLKIIRPISLQHVFIMSGPQPPYFTLC